MISPDWVADPASFRDPNGFVFYRDGGIYRQITSRHEAHYRRLMSSGLYDCLVDSKLLVPHKEVDVPAACGQDCFKIIQPEPIPFCSYIYEWCFSQLKDAALATLQIQKRALDFGMSLRDCSAYNIQFLRGRPLLIDTLSIGIHEAGRPWAAYKQFCQHFLAPLVLMKHVDVRLNRLCVTELDGIPLTLARRLLSYHACTSWSALLHIFLHARFDDDASVAIARKKTATGRFDLNAFRALIDSLENAVAKLALKPGRSPWLTYAKESRAYSEDAFDAKIEIVRTYLQTCKPAEVWDLGANIGVFSRIAAELGARVIAFDQDPYCVEAHYLQVKKEGADVLPLVLNLSNPTPAIGWENQERRSFSQRAGADVVLALALIHHLAISNNLPLSKLASFFAKICRWLIIEFVPKEDPKVQSLLGHRGDIFPRYTVNAFEREFGRLFVIENRTEIRSSKRILYLMRRVSS